MGTNYYLLKKAKYDRMSYSKTSFVMMNDHNEVQEIQNGLLWRNKYYPDEDTLNREFYETYHIGKSSAGWHFNLCIYPDSSINNLDDWKLLFACSRNKIIDEYGNKVGADEMLDIITKREWSRAEYEPTPNATKGIKGLYAHNTPHHIRTSGTYDLTTFTEFD